MIESQTLPPEATQYLNEVALQPKDDIQHQITLQAAKDQLHSFCMDFIKKSADWRAGSFESKWQDYQRNADGIFDPKVAARKESWQSKVHIGITASHRETIHAHLFKVMCGTNPPLEVKSRFDLGDIDQSKNIRDLIARELEKTRWGLVFDSILHDADTYGSGFYRISHLVKKEKRKMKQSIYESFGDNLNPMGVLPFALRAVAGKRKVVGYGEVEEEVTIYRGVDIRHCNIWDIFPDPKALKIPGSSIAWRYKLSYGDIVKGSQLGYYLPECINKLKGVQTTDKIKEGEQTVLSNRGISDTDTTKTDYGTVHDVYEFFARLPKKWIYTIQGDNTISEEEREELVPARVIFHDKLVIAVEINEEYDGEPAIHKMDYTTVNGRFYGRGIPEMLMDSQSVINEIVNQRLDNGALVLNNSFAVLEKALVNPKNDLVSKPGMFIRLDAAKVPNGDVRNAITQFNINDTPLRAGFTEVNESERWAQERTSANRMTLGTAGLINDSNKTLGGQQMLKDSAGEKFSYIGLMMELGSLQEMFHAVWKVLYRNITPEDLIETIGEKRAANFILMTPEEIQRDYTYIPMGVFTMENKGMRQNRLQSIRQQFIGAPWVDDEKFFDKICQTADEDPDVFKRPVQPMQSMPGLPPIPGQGMEQSPSVPPQNLQPPMPMGSGGGVG